MRVLVLLWGEGEFGVLPLSIYLLAIYLFITLFFDLLICLSVYLSVSSVGIWSCEEECRVSE